MRRILAAVACAGIVLSAQAQVITGAMFMPTPLGVVLSIGQWISFESDRVYYIEVQGEGVDPEQARANGFRLAVEQAVGTIIASESEANNGRLTRDEIISYSSAYVYKYEIVKQESGGLGVKTTMRVWCKKSAIANRLLSESKTAGQVDGARAAVNVQSIVQERQTGDRLLATVLNDFPRRAFDVGIGRTQVTYDGNRQSRLAIPITVNFSQTYLDSLWAALSATENPGGLGASVTLKSRGMFASGGTVNYTDITKFQMLQSRMISPTLMVKVSLLDERNSVVYSDVFDMPSLSHSSNNPAIHKFVQPGYRPPQPMLQIGGTPQYQMLIDGRRQVPMTALIDANPALLEQVRTVHVEIVR